jgi:membrane protein YqaA with SNARE-associated domain
MTNNPLPTIKTPSLTKILGSLFFLVVLSGVCALLAKAQIESTGEWLLNKYGLLGVSIATLITDTSPLPLTSEPIALLGVGANIPIWKLIVVMSATSHLCGPLGYVLGKSVSKIEGVQKLLTGRIAPFMNFVRQNGLKAVAMGAILPIPYALTTWTAGALDVSFWGVVKVSSLRWVKTSIYIGLIAVGWKFGTPS